MIPFDDPTVSRILPVRDAQARISRLKAGSDAVIFQGLAHFHRRHGLEGLHDRAGALQPDGVELVHVAGERDDAAAAFGLDLRLRSPPDALVVEQVGIGLLVDRPGVSLEAARQVADVLEPGLLEDAVGEISA